MLQKPEIYVSANLVGHLAHNKQHESPLSGLDPELILGFCSALVVFFSPLMTTTTIILLFVPNKKGEKKKKLLFLHTMYTQYICGKFIWSQN